MTLASPEVHEGCNRNHQYSVRRRHLAVGVLTAIPASQGGRQGRAGADAAVRVCKRAVHYLRGVGI